MDIPTNHMTKLVCHDPWVSFIVTVITIVGVVVYVYRSCRHMTFLKGHKFASICHVHIIFCNNTRYVPLKIGHYIGSPFLFQYNELPLVENITLHKHCLWDIIHVEWDEERIHYKDRSIPLREHLNVPLKDKIRLRWILKKNYQIMYMAGVTSRKSQPRTSANQLHTLPYWPRTSHSHLMVTSGYMAGVTGKK